MQDEDKTGVGAGRWVPSHWGPAGGDAPWWEEGPGQKWGRLQLPKNSLRCFSLLTTRTQPIAVSGSVQGTYHSLWRAEEARSRNNGVQSECHFVKPHIPTDDSLQTRLGFSRAGALGEVWVQWLQCDPQKCLWQSRTRCKFGVARPGSSWLPVLWEYPFLFGPPATTVLSFLFLLQLALPFVPVALWTPLWPVSRVSVSS